MMNKNLLTTKSAEDLLETDYPIREAVVSKFLQVGCYLLVGAPKSGKSFLALQIAVAVANGDKLWGLPTIKRNVLYLALEDTYERLQRRYARISDYIGTDYLRFGVNAPPLHDGFVDVIKDYHNSFDFKLLIIDTLEIIRKPNRRISYSDDYKTISILRDLAYDLNITILIVHHTRKLEAEDQFAKISGTNGLFGASDGAMILERPRRSNSEAKLYCTGRDIADSVFFLKLNLNQCIWDCTGISNNKSEQPPKDTFLEAVDCIVKQHGGHWVGTPKKLHSELANDYWALNKITKRLNHNIDKLRDEYNIQFIYKLLKERTIILDYIKDESIGEEIDGQ